MSWLVIVTAYLLDLIVGDPRAIPHPVVIIGKLITFLDNRLRNQSSSKVLKRAMGVATVMIVVTAAGLTTWAIVRAATAVHPAVGFLFSTIMVSATIATNGLKKSACEVSNKLENNDIDGARQKVAMIVGRDTNGLEQKDIARATIETVAENLVDAVIAPLTYAYIGGASLAMAYRAINTLDSMIGYKNEKYTDFGWAAAKLDDIANYIPARISVVIIAIAAFVKRRNPLKTIDAVVVFGRNHASPNSGLPEAAFAGTLSLKLGGTNYYNGIPRETGFIGDGATDLSYREINNSVSLLVMSSIIMVLVLGVVNMVAMHFK
ncbi:MAG: cobalamin biosynthesis protein CobD [Rubrobacteridae bacterium]|nr:cobalamin biosynthesis protein CobD [Rubrobacteridae bacterium]